MGTGVTSHKAVIYLKKIRREKRDRARRRHTNERVETQAKNGREKEKKLSFFWLPSSLNEGYSNGSKGSE